METETLFSKQQSNIIKGGAILLLLFHHLFYENSRLIENGIYISFYDKLWHIDNMARICVWIFLFISGYGLTIKYNKNRDIKSYFISSWLALMTQWWIIWIVKMIITQVFVENIIVFYKYSTLYFFLDMFEWNDFFGMPVILENWYLCFAQLVILLVPFIDFAVKKFGILCVIVYYVMMQYMQNGIFSEGGGEYIIYIPVLITAVWIAQKDNIKVFLKYPDTKIKQILEMICLVVTIIVSLWMKWKYNIMYLGSIYAIIATIGIVMFIVKYMKIFHKPLGYLGKHSAAMFLIHSYLYLEFPEIIFFHKNAIISYVILVITSLLFAIGIEKIKKIIHYDNLHLLYKKI